MFSCNQCHASTPYECARRHEEQATLHRALVSQRAAMHIAVDEIADKLTAYAELAATGGAIGMSGADIDRLIAGSVLFGSAHRIYRAARDIHVLIASWSKR